MDRKKRFYSSARGERTEKNVFIPPRGLNGRIKTFLQVQSGFFMEGTPPLRGEPYPTF
jgi:hypothetical protein